MPRRSAPRFRHSLFSLHYASSLLLFSVVRFSAFAERAVIALIANSFHHQQQVFGDWDGDLLHRLRGVERIRSRHTQQYFL